MGAPAYSFVRVFSAGGNAGRGVAVVIGVAAWLVFLGGSYGFAKAGLGLTAVLIGIVFFRSQFGFSYAWRELITHGNGVGMRAQLLWIGLCAIPFALLTGATGWTDGIAVANLRPLGLPVAIGAALFGIGMQLGGACTSGSITGAGKGGGALVVSLFCFVVGALIAAAQIGFWQDNFTMLPAFSFPHEWGIGGAFFTIAVCAALAAFTRRFAATPVKKPAGRMSLYTAAVWLAVLTIALLCFAGQPWGILNGLTIAGGKALLTQGADDIEFWAFWARFAAGSEVLYDGWFAHSQLVTSVGMLLGVAAAATLAGQFKLTLPTPRRFVFAVAGGLIMGYGAQISFGCNIGSYISALSSGSAHGWLWLFFAFVGTHIGVRLRKWGKLD